MRSQQNLGKVVFRNYISGVDLSNMDDWFNRECLKCRRKEYFTATIPFSIGELSTNKCSSFKGVHNIISVPRLYAQTVTCNEGSCELLSGLQTQTSQGQSTHALKSRKSNITVRSFLILHVGGQYCFVSNHDHGCFPAILRFIDSDLINDWLLIIFRPNNRPRPLRH